MKNIKTIIITLVLSYFCFTNCTKETNIPLVDDDTVEASNSQGVVYASFSCEMADGTTGCNCEITAGDDDCSLVTECTSSEIELLNYNNALHEMFSQEEINQRTLDHVRITEPELREALIQDGFPII